MTLLQSSSSLRSGQSALRSHRWINGWQVPSVQVNWSSEQAVKVNVVLPSKISHNRSSKSQSKRPVDQFEFSSSNKQNIRITYFWPKNQIFTFFFKFTVFLSKFTISSKFTFLSKFTYKNMTKITWKIVQHLEYQPVYLRKQWSLIPPIEDCNKCIHAQQSSPNPRPPTKYRPICKITKIFTEQVSFF